MTLKGGSPSFDFGWSLLETRKNESKMRKIQDYATRLRHTRTIVSTVKSEVEMVVGPDFIPIVYGVPTQESIHPVRRHPCHEQELHEGRAVRDRCCRHES